MRLVLISAVCCVLSFLSCWTQAAERTWRDVSGQYSVKAEFVGLDGDQISLLKADGKVIQIPIQKLSSVDRRWLARNKKQPSEAKAGTEVLVSKDWPRWRGPNADGIFS